jgi:hypothetical protein
MFKYLWLLPIALFIICVIIACIENVGIKNFIEDVVFSLLIGFGMGCVIGFTATILFDSLISFFFAYDDMNAIWNSIKEVGLGGGCVGAIIVTLVTLMDDCNTN